MFLFVLKYFVFALMIRCEGRCLRSFHATKKAGIDGSCESLGYTSAQVKVSTVFLIFGYFVWSVEKMKAKKREEEK